jgi:hypothetical protein
MFQKIKEFFFGKPTAVEPIAVEPKAPYKIETPATDWPFPKPIETASEPALVVTPAPVKKPRAPAKPKATPAAKPTTARPTRTRKTPAK